MSITNTPWQGFLGDPPTKPLHKFMKFDNAVYEVHTPVVLRFIAPEGHLLTNVGETIWAWIDSEEGKWVMSKSVQSLEWRRQTEPVTYSEHYIVRAFLKGPDYTFWTIKWGNQCR